MNRFHRLISGSIVAITLGLNAEPAPAQFVVFDPNNYAQNVLTAARALQQINNQIVSLQNQAQMLINQAKNLATLPFSSLLQLEQSILRTQQLLAQDQRIAYDIGQIDRAIAAERHTGRIDFKEARRRGTADIDCPGVVDHPLQEQRRTVVDVNRAGGVDGMAIGAVERPGRTAGNVKRAAIGRSERAAGDGAVLQRDRAAIGQDRIPGIGDRGVLNGKRRPAADGQVLERSGAVHRHRDRLSTKPDSAPLPAHRHDGIRSSGT